ncbi:MAG: glycosyltransferase [Pyrinomonadaceae bacterium]
MPKVSVVMPAYNHERFVRAAIESVLMQTLDDLELCVTDDGSTDSTADIVSSFKDPRIRFHRLRQNSGVCVALNDAIRRSRGEYIAVLNSDDIFLSDKLRTQSALLDARADLGAIFGMPEFIDDVDQVVPPSQTFYGNIFQVENKPRHEWLRDFFFRGNSLCHPTVMIRRSCHDDIGLYDERLAQVHDFDLWVRFIQRYQFLLMPEVMTLFRIVGGEGNASAPRPSVVTRLEWEFGKVLRHYAGIDEDLFAKAFENDLAQCNIDPALPRAAKLGWLAMSGRFMWTKRFGLDQLFEAVPAEGKNESSQAGIRARDLISLAGESDQYGRYASARAATVINEMSAKIADLESVISARSPLASDPVETAGSWLAKRFHSNKSKKETHDD